MQLQSFDGNIGDFDLNNRHAGDEKLPVVFRMDALKDEAASDAAGRPIYKDAEFIRIFVHKDSIIDRPVRDEDKERWPRAYAAWKQTGVSDPGAVGTRLEHWPQMTRAQVEEYKYFKIYTVEQLAELPDNIAQTIMGAPKMKQMARLAVEAAKGELPFLKMQKELEERDLKISQLTAEVGRLAKVIEERMQVVPVKA